MRRDWFLMLGLVLALGGPASGQPRREQAPDDAGAGRRAQLAAAVDNGLAALRRDVYATPFSVGLTVRQAAGRLEAVDPLDQAIQTAEQWGGPRWQEDRQICEVRLELPGSTVAAAIHEAGAKQFAKLGLTSDAFARAVNHLKSQRFAATGVGAAAAVIVEKPADGAAPAWQAVPEPARTEAYHNAKNNAANRVIEGLGTVRLGEGQTLADLLDKPDVAGEFRQWLADRPATDVEYGEDLAVRLRLTVKPDDVWPLVERNLKKHKLGPAPEDADGWRRLREEVARAMPAPMGRAVPPLRPVAAAVGQTLVPRDPPAWAGRQMDADGQGSGKDLKGARAAETMARAQLRAQVEDLDLTPGVKLGDAAKRDSRVARALSGALRRARVSQVTFDKDSVTARVNLDLDWVWRGLTAIE